MGAEAVCIGRPYLELPGVGRVLEILRARRPRLCSRSVTCRTQNIAE